MFGLAAPYTTEHFPFLVHRTRCAEEDEEEVASREVRSMFPNTIDDDFGDLIDAITLEQKPEYKTKAKSSAADLLQSADISDICRTFANIMSRFSRSYYYQPKQTGQSGDESPHDYLRDYKAKFQVFVELFPKFAGGLNSSIDETVYNGVSLLVGDRMHEMNLLKLNGELVRSREWAL